MSLLHAVGKAASFALSLWPSGLTSGLFNEPADRLWDQSSRTTDDSAEYFEFFPGKRFPPKDYPQDWGLPRVIEDRGLGDAEQDAEWRDKYGFKWTFERGKWMTALGCHGQLAVYTPHPWFAPYTEIIPDSSADGVASATDENRGPSVGERPASCDGLRDGAGHPASDADCSRPGGLDRASQPNADGHNPSNIAEVPAGTQSSAGHLTSGDLRDAAYAIKGFADGHTAAAGLGYVWHSLAEKLTAAADIAT